MRKVGLGLVVAIVALSAASPSRAHADTVTPACSAAPTDCSGPWYTSPVDLSWTFDPDPPDSTSPGCDPQTINETTSSGQSVTCTATWGADPPVDGNVTIKVDTTNPTVDGANAGRSADSNGWFNHTVSFDFFGSDTPSGISSCSSGVSYSGPDSATASVDGTCTDVAGNTGDGSQTFKYDATAPTVTSGTPKSGPDGTNGWYVTPPTYDFSGTDNLSGIDTCPSVTYAGGDSATASVTGVCHDNAGNDSAGLVMNFKYDHTAPETTGSALDRGPDLNGWYNHPVAVNFTGTDATSGVGSPCGSVTYSGPDGPAVQASGSCTDLAGNVDLSPLASPAFAYDSTGPAVSGVPDRPPDSGGWYNHPVSFSFQGADDASGVSSCSSNVVYGGPDSASAAVGGSCQDVAGNMGSGSAPLRYDHTPPTVLGALPDRLPDHNGWFNHPVRLAFQGVDSLSGGVACSHYTYTGDQNAHTLVSGTCTDAAGNSATASFAMRYDATPPAAPQAVTTPQNAKVLVTWTKPADATRVRVTRSRGKRTKVVYAGKGTSFLDRHLRNGKHYMYTVTVFDQAGNRTSTAVPGSPTALSLRPLPGTVVSLPPKLTWKRVRRARYYNLQLYLGKTKVLSTWPRKSSFQLPPSWTYGGHDYSFVAGPYTWYVWPGIGPRSKNRYGHLLGKSSFTVLG
ncbi:MAG TPA: hypothetical protein VF032_13970 [Thermoleophilaceae bacterium]